MPTRGHHVCHTLPRHEVIMHAWVAVPAVGAIKHKYIWVSVGLGDDSLIWIWTLG